MSCSLAHVEAAKLSTNDHALKIIAQDIGAAIGVTPEELKFSDGWLQGFKSRFGLHSIVMHGEAASASLAILGGERVALKRIRSNYGPEDIFKAGLSRMQLVLKS